MPTLTNFTFANVPGTGDIKVLNFALAAEALEANLYVQAIQRLTTGGTNVLTDGRSINIPGLNIAATEPDVSYLQLFARVEREHRDFLISALGAAAITAPGQPLNRASFDFKMETLTRAQVLALIYTVENTGVQAYLGAIPFFSTKTFLPIAGGIQATEARHTATVAIVYNLLFGPTYNTAPLANETTRIINTNVTAGIDGTLTPDQVLVAVLPNIVVPASGQQ